MDMANHIPVLGQVVNVPPTVSNFLLFTSTLLYIWCESESEVTQSCLSLCDPTDYIAYQASPSMGFSRQEYWSGLPFPSPGDLPDPGIEPKSPSL